MIPQPQSPGTFVCVVYPSNVAELLRNQQGLVLSWNSRKSFYCMRQREPTSCSTGANKKIMSFIRIVKLIWFRSMSVKRNSFLFGTSMYTSRALKELTLFVIKSSELTMSSSPPKWACIGALELAPPQYLKFTKYLCLKVL